MQKNKIQKPIENLATLYISIKINNPINILQILHLIEGENNDAKMCIQNKFPNET